MMKTTYIEIFKKKRYVTIWHQNIPENKTIQMTMLQTHMLISKKSVSKGTLDAILLRLAHSAISSPKQKKL